MSEDTTMDTVQTESTVNFAVMAKCAHTDCICTVGSGERFCSDYCAEHAGMRDAAADDTCSCGHPECAHSR
jgi:hypothetical protein